MIGWILLALLALLVLLACCLRMRVSAGYDERGGWEIGRASCRERV